MPEDGKDTDIDRRRFVQVTGAGVAVGALAGCLVDGDGGDGSGDGDDGGDGSGGSDGSGDGDDGGSDGGSGGSDIVVGGVQPYSGPFAEVATEFEAGFEMALSEVNEDGGVLDGQEIVLETADSETNPSEAATLATSFIEQDDAVALTGPVSTDSGLQVAQIAEDFEVPVVFNQVGSHDATTQDSRYTYRMGLLPAPTTAQAITQFVREREFDSVSAVIADYGYGRAFEEAMNAEFPEDIDLQMQVAPFREDDFSPYIREMPEDVDVVIATSHPPGAVSIFQTIQELAVDPEYVLGVSEEKPIWSALEESATEGWVNVTQPSPFSDQYADVGGRFVDENGEHFGVLAALGYSAGSMIVAAVEEAGEADPVAISDAIRNVDHDSLFAEPIQYTEWGELDQVRQVFTTFAEGGPDWNEDNEWHLEEEFTTDPLDGFDPDTWSS